MSELRKDPIIGRWVIISTERGLRPSDWTSEPQSKRGGICPFCPGNESMTPPEILAFRGENGTADVPGWKIRVVPNKFPALQVEGELLRKGEGNYDIINGIGAHEVIIESPSHAADLADLPVDHIAEVLLMFRKRALDLRSDRRLQYVLIFKNHGVAAGASLEHTHSQLIATPIVPKQVVEEIQGSKKFFAYKKRCVFCDIIQQELRLEKRVVTSRNGFLVVQPFAPRFSFETWILPETHYSNFENMPIESYNHLAAILRETLNRLNKILGYPPYNFIVHSSPIQENELLDYHWHIEIIPKLNKIAGFEWGSGFYINPTPPEIAAENLRAANLV